MRMRLLIFLMTLSIYAQGNNSGCPLEKLPGEWAGEFVFNTGTTYIMQLNVDKVKNCKGTGTLYWPDYFNCASQVEITSGDEIIMLEKKIVQGVQMDINDVYKITNITDSLLEGTVISDGQKVARFTLQNKSFMDPSELQALKQKLEFNASKFGTAEIGEEVSDKTLEEIQNKMTEAQNEMEAYIKTMKMEGSATVQNMEVPIRAEIVFPNLFLLSMTFQNVEFRMARNDSISWQYDPFNDEVSTSETDESGFSNLFGRDLKGYKVVKGNKAKVDGIETTRLLYSNEDDEYMVYFVDTNSNIIRQEDTDHTIRYFMKYEKVGNILMPHQFREVTLDGINGYKFDKIILNDSIDKGIFKVPEKSVKENLSAASKDDSYFYKVGNDAFDKENYNDAIDAYTSAIRINDRNKRYFYYRGRSWFEKDDFYKAISDFNRAVELDPEYSFAWIEMGKAKYYLKDKDNAIKDLTRGIKFDSVSDDAYSSRAWVYLQKANWDSAFLDYHKALELKPDAGNYSYYAGLALAQTGEYDSAIYYYTLAFKNDYINSKILNHAGVSYYKLGRYEEALDLFVRSSKEDSTSYIVFQNIGDTYSALGNYDSALYAFERATKLNPDNDFLMNQQGKAYYNRGDYEISLQYFSKAIQLNSKNQIYYQNRAASKRELEDYVGAIEDFTSAIDIDPTNPENFYARGLLKSIQQDNLDACKDFKKAADLGYEEANKQLEEKCSYNKKN